MPQTTSVTRYVLIAVAIVGVTAMAWLIADALIIAFGGIVFATVLRAMMDPLIRLTGWKDRWALVTVVGGLLTMLALLIWLFGHQAANQFADLRQQIPVAADKFSAWLSESRLGRVAVELLQQAGATEKSLTGAGGFVTAVLGGMGNLLLIIFGGIYLAADPRLYRDGLLRLFPLGRRAQVRRALDEGGGALRKWLVAQIVVMAAVGTLTSIGLVLLGVPLWLSLGLLAGLLEFIPVFGPILALVPGGLLAFAIAPEKAVYVVVLYIVVQQIESNLLTPLVQRWAVELPPVIALLAIVAGGLLFGVLGAIFATPLAVVVMVLVRCLYVEDTLERPRPERRRVRPMKSELAA